MVNAVQLAVTFKVSATSYGMPGQVRPSSTWRYKVPANQ